MTPVHRPLADHEHISEHFESMYRDAHRDASRLPWCDGRANPALVAWLNHVAPKLVRCGSRVAVVGCGLGDDARAIAGRGYDVTAFDCSETAIEWARTLDPSNAGMYHTADLFEYPPKWRHRFDLVVEIYTLQSLPPSMRSEAMQAIAELMGPHGHLLVIARGTEDSVVGVQDGPPWPLTKDELLDAAADAGLAPRGVIDMFQDDETPPKWRLRGTFDRA